MRLEIQDFDLPETSLGRVLATGSVFAVTTGTTGDVFEAAPASARLVEGFGNDPVAASAALVAGCA